MTFYFVGYNEKAKMSLDVTRARAIAAVLTTLVGKEVELGPADANECKIWANALRDSLQGLRLIKGVNKKTGMNYGFLVVQGADINRMFSGEHYKHASIDFQPSWELAIELDDTWKAIVNDFVDFLDTCEGIARVV
jgi:hypothetical protein